MRHPLKLRWIGYRTLSWKMPNDRLPPYGGSGSSRSLWCCKRRLSWHCICVTYLRAEFDDSCLPRLVALRSGFASILRYVIWSDFLFSCLRELADSRIVVRNHLLNSEDFVLKCLYRCQESIDYEVLVPDFRRILWEWLHLHTCHLISTSQ